MKYLLTTMKTTPNGASISEFGQLAGEFVGDIPLTLIIEGHLIDPGFMTRQNDVFEIEFDRQEVVSINGLKLEQILDPDKPSNIERHYYQKPNHSSGSVDDTDYDILDADIIE